MGKLFGTDGIRGQANRYPMTVEIAQALGLAITYILSQNTDNSKKIVVIGKDTRQSGDMLEAALSSGLCAGGYDVIQVGIVPTPAVAYLTKFFDADAGFVISASHNPAQDNGIKVFGADGYKMPDQLEADIESCLLSKSYENYTPDECGLIFDESEARHVYIDNVIESIPQQKMKNLSVVVDCANGAAATVVGDIFDAFDMSLEIIHDDTDGDKPINENCGAMDTRSLQSTVIENKADLGIAFDGDADRLVLCDHKGEPLNGDHILAICGQYLIQTNRLPQNTLVATQYSNMGLDDSIQKCGGKVIRVLNGDRYVIEKMRAEGLMLGGEASGHMIFHEQTTTGDGLIAALQILNIMQETRQPLAQLKQCISFYPQVTKNVTVKEKKDLQSLPEVMNQINEVNKKLGTDGRTLIRYSGTENKVRIMIEGKDKEKITEYAERIAKEIQIQIGI
ncbi:phosphoglucosamine mutase [Candidatus Magnetomorum sp. HK-1]|nr:phosphoglucosamine mutase [Candidatus Magnetomorum sp. HK-1]